MRRVPTQWPRQRWIMAALALALIASNVWAHPISMSAVAVNVQEAKILANMKIRHLSRDGKSSEQFVWRNLAYR